MFFSFDSHTVSNDLLYAISYYSIQIFLTNQLGNYASESLSQLSDWLMMKDVKYCIKLDHGLMSHFSLIALKKMD